MPQTREQFLSKAHGRVQEVPFNGDTYHVRTLSLDELVKVRRAVRDAEEENEGEAALVAMVVAALSDEQGNRLLKETDGPLVRGKPTELLVALSDAATELNRVDAARGKAG